MDVLHSTLSSPNVAKEAGKCGGWGWVGAEPRAPLRGYSSELQRPFRSFNVCELNVAGSLTSVKPTTTVSVCSLGLLQRQAQTRSIAGSILLPDFKFACDNDNSRKATSKNKS